MKDIAIIYGGRSTEHDASVKSKETFVENLSKDRFNIVEIIFVDREGRIFCNEEEIKIGDLVNKIKYNKSIFYLNLLHGNEGEDGAWCGVFEVCDGIGSFETVNTSSILMNKYQQSCVVNGSNLGLKIPQTVLVRSGYSDERIKQKINQITSEFIIVKPNTMGASHFTKKFSKEHTEQIINFIKSIFEYDKAVLVQEFIVGEEYTCGVIQYKGDIKPLPIIHVKTNTDFLGHEEKHKPGYTTIDFNDFDEKSKINKISSELFEIFNIIGMCRFDFLIESVSKQIYFLEGNLIPGFSSGSAFPRMLKKADVSFDDFVDNLYDSYTNYKKNNKYLPYKIED